MKIEIEGESAEDIAAKVISLAKLFGLQGQPSFRSDDGVVTGSVAGKPDPTAFEDIGATAAAVSEIVAKPEEAPKTRRGRRSKDAEKALTDPGVDPLSDSHAPKKSSGADLGLEADEGDGDPAPEQPAKAADPAHEYTKEDMAKLRDIVNARVAEVYSHPGGADKVSALITKVNGKWGKLRDLPDEVFPKLADELQIAI